MLPSDIQIVNQNCPDLQYWKISPMCSDWPYSQHSTSCNYL